ncbi:MAG: tetratricopeptide repeat protein [Hyphomicrobium sp.]|uniref:tetratricopeptide repeat protein n=1 Tax=Hyphomicrobium sp. TaxID=82 RepID=UPI003D0965E6
MSKTKMGSLAGLVVVAVACIAPQAGIAAMDEPAPRPTLDCTDPVNAGKPACAPQNSAASDDEIYEAAYKAAKGGDYEGALATARRAANPDDPRILRVSGFATRKLGDVDGAMPFYQKALTINPADTRTRQYMGEAFLQQGDFGNARLQLREIEKICGGVTCEDYQKLADAIGEMHAKLPRGI